VKQKIHGRRPYRLRARSGRTANSTAIGPIKSIQPSASYYKKGPGMDRYTDLKTDPSVAIDQEIVHGIQDARLSADGRSSW
jgi:hypothetical protein